MRTITYRDALREAIREEMQRDERVFILGEDIAGYGGTYAVSKGLFEEFGEKRVRYTPLAEEVITGAAIGAALGGLRPILELMTINFSLLASDQIVNQAAKFRYMFGGQPEIPLVIRMPGGGGAQRGAQHSQSLESWYAHIPGLKVVMPATPYDAKGMLKSAVRDPDPVLFIEHELLYNVKGEVPDEGVEYTVPLNRGEVKRQGQHVTIITFSRMLHVTLQAAEDLAKEGIEAEVIDLRSIRPIDNFCFDSFFSQVFSGLQCDMQHAREGDNRHMLALAFDLSSIERYCILNAFVGDFAFHVVEQFMLDEQHGIRVAHC